MLLIGTVERVRNGSLVVRDRRNRRPVIVHARYARRFSVGDVVSILFSGAMTRSNPPQISAIAIRRISSRLER